MEAQERWIAGHLYHHQSLDPVVLGFVHPCVAALVGPAWVDGFFFVRYGLGGPHVRLRLRTAPEAREEVAAAMQAAAERFLGLAPSTASLDEETIRRTNEALLAGDSNEDDAAVYPDNSFRFAPFRPEVRRYGGPTLLQSSLDFFTLSSVAALDLTARHADGARSTLLAPAMRRLLLQALGFAADESELIDLLRYGVDSWGGALPKVLEKGDKVALAQREIFQQMLRQGFAAVQTQRIELVPLWGPAELLTAGARRLSATVGIGDRMARARIGGSQLHMTASRLGLSNAEETYLSRLLTVTLGELCACGEADLSWLEEAAATRTTGGEGDDVGALLPSALAALARIPVPRLPQTPLA